MTWFNEYHNCGECKHYEHERIGAHGGDYGYCQAKSIRTLAVRKACNKYFEEKENDKLPDNSKDAP